jgi:tRNA/tmRNA/rRNA uracil-C5-methylase (TrmA/RlmC/RlmD family)
MGLEQGLSTLRGVHSSLPDVAIASGDARSALGYVSSRTTVVLDPPRKGLEPALLDALCERQPRKLVYVSCGFQAFKRDAEALVRFGYRLKRTRAFALFPFTDHVETLAEFVLE